MAFTLLGMGGEWPVGIVEATHPVWSQQPTGIIDQTFEDVHVVNVSVIWAAGGGGRVALSTDSGVTWSLVPVPGNPTLKDVYAVDASTAWVVGGSSLVHKTTNGGVNWVSTTTGLGVATTIEGSGAGNIFVGGRNTGSPFKSQIRNSVDGGATWSTVYTGTVNNGLVADLSVVDSVTTYAATTAGLVKTVNNGASWTLSSTTYKPDGIWAANADVVWGVDSPLQVVRTTDAGASWELVKSDSGFNLIDVVAHDDQVAFVVGHAYRQFTNAGGVIFGTTDGGGIWVEQVLVPPPELGGSIFGIGKASLTAYWAVGTAGNVYSLNEAAADTPPQAVTNLFTVECPDMMTVEGTWFGGHATSDTFTFFRHESGDRTLGGFMAPDSTTPVNQGTVSLGTANETIPYNTAAGTSYQFVAYNVLGTNEGAIRYAQAGECDEELPPPPDVSSLDYDHLDPHVTASQAQCNLDPISFTIGVQGVITGSETLNASLLDSRDGQLVLPPIDKDQMIQMGDDGWAFNRTLGAGSYYILALQDNNGLGSDSYSMQAFSVPKGSCFDAGDEAYILAQNALTRTIMGGQHDEILDALEDVNATGGGAGVLAFGVDVGETTTTNLLFLAGLILIGFIIWSRTADTVMRVLGAVIVLIAGFAAQAQLAEWEYMWFIMLFTWLVSGYMVFRAFWDSHIAKAEARDAMRPAYMRN